MADGKIVIDTTVNSDGAVKGVKEVEKNIAGAMERVEKAISDASEKMEYALDAAKDNMRKLESDGKWFEDPDYDKAFAELSAIEKKVKDYKKNLANPEKGLQEASETKHLEEIRENAIMTSQEVVALEEELGRLKNQQADLSKAGIGLGYEEYDSNIARIGEIETALKEYKASLLETEQEEQRSSRLKDFLASALAKIAEAARKTGSAVKQLTMRMLSMAGSAATSGLKKLSAGILGIHKSANKSTISLSKMLKYLIGIRSMYALFGRIRSAVQDGFENLAQASGSTNAAISSLMTALTQLKNSFAAAFAPILNVVAPILVKFINLISQAITYVGMFIAALTGQKTYTKAVAAQEDYAAGLEKTAKNANKATKALKRYKSPLDEINNYEKQDQSDTSGNPGGYTGPSPGEMFQTVPIESSLKGIADKIRKLIKDEDFEGLGTYLASGINAGLKKIKAAISWENVGPAITKFVTAFTTTFNSLVRNIDWDLMGQTFGAGINTLVYTLLLLIGGIDWESLGNAFGRGINGVFTEVDFYAVGSLIGQKMMILPTVLHGIVTRLNWPLIGQGIATALNGVVGSIDLSTLGALLGLAITGLFSASISFSQNFNWEELGKNIYAGINNLLATLDFATIAEAFNTFAGGFLSMIIVAIGGVDWEQLGHSVADLILGVDWGSLALQLLTIGVQLVMGLLDGIIAGLSDIGSWMKQHVFDPIVKWFKNLFGIHSPSTVFSQFGKYLIEGLRNGIKNSIQMIFDVFKKLWDGAKDSFNAFNKFVAEVFSGDWTKNFGALGDFLQNTFLKSISETVDAIKTVFNGLIELIEGVFTGNWEKAWNGVRDIFSGVFEGLSGIAKNPINAIIGGFNSVIGTMNGLINRINSISFKITVPDWVPGIGGAWWGFNGFNIPTVGSIPYLASGAVIPPRSEFLAVLGDQKHGNNIETPEALLRKIVREESGIAKNSGGQYRFTAQINRRTLFDEMITEAKMRRTMSGNNPFELA